MLRITNLNLPLAGDGEQLHKKAARLLQIPPDSLLELQIVRQSIDARKKSDLHLVYTVNVRVAEEEKLLRRLSALKNVTRLEPLEYRFPAPRRTSERMPVVAGMGPAGLFAALYLARNGIPSLVLERGRPVEQRARDVEAFWSGGPLDPVSNVQFGEGGAGTFSDGKLTTGTHDPRIRTVLDTLVQAGAPADAAYSHKPHIGTDVLRRVVRVLREELISLGCDVRFEAQLTGLQQQNGQLTGITVRQGGTEYGLDCDALILAPGHSARDTFAMLQASGVPLAPKSFAIGVRMEHHQERISRAQYGEAWNRLPPSDYKLSCHLPSGRSAFTFCVCPGGQVVAAASAPGGLVTNGMSCRARDGVNINGGFLVGVGPSDFPGGDPLAGVRFQETWERLAWELGGRNFSAPAQRAADFLVRRPSASGGEVEPSYRPGVAWTDLDRCLPPFVTDTLREALPLFDRKVRGFAAPDAVLTGVETRSSSPVRILRDGSGQSALRGLYPCGEGAGYAGGIVSAAVDGIRMAEAVAKG
ncbi:MAG: hypothetical protein HFF18_09975 [Oscillospiraceae bacterium]|nr:hypothetical protein [Oscillospiraceae bacterium]